MAGPIGAPGSPGAPGPPGPIGAPGGCNSGSFPQLFSIHGSHQQGRCLASVESDTAVQCAVQCAKSIATVTASSHAGIHLRRRSNLPSVQATASVASAAASSFLPRASESGPPASELGSETLRRRGRAQRRAKTVTTGHMDGRIDPSWRRPGGRCCRRSAVSRALCSPRRQRLSDLKRHSRRRAAAAARAAHRRFDSECPLHLAATGAFATQSARPARASPAG